MKAARSHLYVPGDRPDVLAKAATRGADALILDLEDAVTPSAKDVARRTVSAFLAEIGSNPGGPATWVRINPGSAGSADLDAVVMPGLNGLCVAKADGPTQLAELAATLSRMEKERGIRASAIAISPLLESGAAVLRAEAIASAPRVVRLQIGEADLQADLGVEPGPDARELWWARSMVVLASAAAHIEPPVGPVSTDYNDLETLRESTLALKRMGFGSRACIHPAQVAVVNEVFTPTHEELERAAELVARYEQAAEAGDGICTDTDGRMIDAAVVRAAQRTLAIMT